MKKLCLMVVLFSSLSQLQAPSLDQQQNPKVSLFAKFKLFLSRITTTPTPRNIVVPVGGAWEIQQVEAEDASGGNILPVVLSPLIIQKEGERQYPLLVRKLEGVRKFEYGEGTRDNKGFYKKDKLRISFKVKRSAEKLWNLWVDVYKKMHELRHKEVVSFFRPLQLRANLLMMERFTEQLKLDRPVTDPHFDNFANITDKEADFRDLCSKLKGFAPLQKQRRSNAWKQFLELLGRIELIYLNGHVN